MWKCLECGKKFKKSRERCSGCRGVDIDLDVPETKVPSSDKGIRQQFLSDLEKVYNEEVYEPLPHERSNSPKRRSS